MKLLSNRLFTLLFLIALPSAVLFVSTIPWIRRSRGRLPLNVSLPVENNDSICVARAVTFDSEVTDGYWLAGRRRVVRICPGGQHVTHIAILLEDGARGAVSGVSPVSEKDDPSGKQADTPDFDDRSGELELIARCRLAASEVLSAHVAVTARGELMPAGTVGGQSVLCPSAARVG